MLKTDTLLYNKLSLKQLCCQHMSGHLGPPLACNIVKLVDVKELNILTDRDAIGEVLLQFQDFVRNFNSKLILSADLR